MSIKTLLRLWTRAVDQYTMETKRIMSRIIKQVNEEAPEGENLEDLIETLGESIVLAIKSIFSSTPRGLGLEA